MKKTTMAYASLVAIIGISAGLWCCWEYFSTFSARGRDIPESIILAAMLLLCRCLPLNLRSDVAIEMSFIGVLTIFLLQGPVAAGAMLMITAPFFVAPSPVEPGKYIHIFNTPFIKTAFNTGMLEISVLGAGYLYFLLGGVDAGLELPECILPVIVYVIVSILLNTVLMSILAYIEMRVSIWKSLLSGFGGFLPNILFSAPVGYFIAYVFTLGDGPYIALLFLLPLLLARYSFKLYLDSRQQQYKVINALSAAIEAKDFYTVGHSKRVELISELIAKQLKLSRRKIETIKIAALFHDIGKIGIHDSILNKPGALSDDERAEINTHPTISAKILEDIDFYGDIKDIIIYHHERYDGKGYPSGISGEELPIESTIIAVADAYDAMTSDRPYRKGFTPDKAVGILREESGRQFAPAPAEALIKLYEEGKLENV